MKVLSADYQVILGSNFRIKFETWLFHLQLTLRVIVFANYCWAIMLRSPVGNVFATISDQTEKQKEINRLIT